MTKLGDPEFSRSRELIDKTQPISPRHSDSLSEPQRSEWLESITREGHAEARAHADQLREDTREAESRGQVGQAKALEKEAVRILHREGLDETGKQAPRRTAADLLAAGEKRMQSESNDHKPARSLDDDNRER